MKRLEEDIYSSQTRKFIRFAKKVESREFDDISKEKDLIKKCKLIYNYLQDNFQIIGGGAYRKAFMSDKYEIIKVVKPSSFFEDAIRQNQIEIMEFNRSDVTIFPRVEEASSDGIWFIVEKVVPIDTMSEDKAKKVLVELFPKYFGMLKEIFELPFWKLGVGYLFAPLRVMLNTFDPGNERETAYGIQYGEEFFQVLKKIGPPLRVQSHSDYRDEYNPDEGWTKEKIKAIQDYLSNPDKNLKLAIHAFNSTDMPMDDFHLGNFGVSDDGKLKIIDIGV